MSRRLAWEVAFVVGAIAAALLVRTLLFAVYGIPSESMLPGLMAGDYVLVEKWSYGWRHTRMPGALPRRGDMVVFKAPPSGRDYVKRVIGLPGDEVGLRGGAIMFDGKPLPRWRIADSVVPVAPNSPCRSEGGLPPRVERDESRTVCRSARWRELLPGGHMVDTLDLGITGGDDIATVVVPPGHLFLLGDNRDRSADSRWPAREGSGVGMVPVDALVGRVRVILLSVDGSARPAAPRGWLRAIRWERTGMGF